MREPPLVLAPVPARTADVTVRTMSLNAFARAMYRPLWKLHPSLHYLQSFITPSLRAVAAWRPDVILAGHVYLAPLAHVLSRMAGTPYVVLAYGQEVWRGGRRMGLRALDERLRGGSLKSADRVLVPGTFTHGLVREWCVAFERIACVPYGADPRPPAPAPTGSTLLSVGRVVPRKGIDTVIAALRTLPPHVGYRVVGSGPDAPRLRDLAEREGVADRVRFLGRLDDAALAVEYQRSTVFVQPARRTPDGQLEGYGLVYFEAAAWGRPVIAGRSGGEVDAVIDGTTGLLVDGASVEAVGAAIRALLDDPERLRAMGEAGRRRVETTHNWTRAAAVVDEVLSQLA
jgi:phosphatidylinositol alpha-1,6-mannosyltransferase